jgi:hypothetical protein
MPGLVGVTGDHAALGAVRTATAALCHFASYRSRELSLDARIAVGQVWRDADRSAVDWAIERDAALLVNGTALANGPASRRLSARALLERHLERGELAPRDLDGGFVVVLADLRRGTVTVYNDRLGTLPVYYLRAAGSVAFAPETKALFAAFDRGPALSKTGVLSFLACGYCLGDTTLFDGVQCLTPGSALEIAVATGECTVRRYWRIAYAPARALARRAAAEDALYAAVHTAHERVVSDGGHDLLLSGGWDSRGILAFLHSIGRLPCTATAWGRTKDIPLSDPYIAERLAERYRVPFKFIAYDSDQLLPDASSWCYLSELANDNLGWFAEGATLLAQSYATSAECTLVGDEAWGWHGHPRTERDARAAVLPPTLGAELAECIVPAQREECRALYEAEIERVLADCPNDHPADRRDFLYLHGRVARFIFALGYYKELAVEIRRPFLLANVLEVMARVPHRLRADKNLYISMLARYFPQIAAVPQRRANSLPQWSRDLRVKPALRRFFLDLLDERRFGAVLGSLLDGAALERLKRSFFDAQIAPAEVEQAPRRSAARHLPLRLRQRIRATGLYPGSRNMSGAYPARGRTDLVRCIALLNLLDASFASELKARRPQTAAARSRL